MSPSYGISDQHASAHELSEYDPLFADPGHGNSRPAWISVTVMLAAVVLGTLFFFLDIPVLVWASAALLVIGALLWPILARLDRGRRSD